MAPWGMPCPSLPRHRVTVGHFVTPHCTACGQRSCGPQPAVSGRTATGRGRSTEPARSPRAQPMSFHAARGSPAAPRPFAKASFPTPAPFLHPAGWRRDPPGAPGWPGRRTGLPRRATLQQSPTRCAWSSNCRLVSEGSCWSGQGWGQHAHPARCQDHISPACWRRGSHEWWA